MKTLKALALIIVFPLAGLFLIGLFQDTTKSKGNKAWLDEKGGEAFAICKRFVKQELRAPHTAEFSWGADITYLGKRKKSSFGEEGGYHSWTVSSEVIAENAFGGEIKTEWICDVTYVGDREWKKQSVYISD